MTETEKERLREMKRETAEALAGLCGNMDKGCREALQGTDARLGEYFAEVSAHPERHNLYELLAARRFFTLMGKYRWNASRARCFIRFYESLKFSGVSGRRRYRLTPIQTFQFASIYGFEDSDGTRLTRTAYIFVPRKFSKTTSAAAMAVYDMLFGDSNAQAYVGANSYAQAKICFDEIRAIVRGIDPSERTFKVNRETISFRKNERNSFIRCLASDAKTQDGLFASLVIMDEYAQARNTAYKSGADLKNVLTTSMGPRREPLTVIITTASDVVDGPFAHELEFLKKMLRGEVSSDSVFASLFMPDVDDREDDPATWAKVQPHMGVTVRPDFYRRQYEEALLSAENMVAFRTKLLNVFTVNSERTWFTYEKARELLGPFDIDRLRTKSPCTVAFDLSVRDDFSAVSYTVYERGERKFYTYTEYYFPEGALKGHPNAELYRLWHEQGYLKFCKGDMIDVRQIADDILRRSKVSPILRIGFDAYKAKDLVNTLAAAGASDVLLPFSQTYGSFNLPVESFEMLAYSTPPRITLNDNPINLYCLSNCVIDTDRLENKKPMKASQYRKIDGVITTLMTIGMMYNIEV